MQRFFLIVALLISLPISLQAEEMPIVRKTTQLKLNRILSNSFGFGGTNACLVFERFNQ